MDLHRLNIAFKCQPGQIMMVYSDEKRAKAAFDLLEGNANLPTPVELKDDFGSTLSIRRDDCLFTMISDNAQANEGNAEIGMQNARCEVKARSKAAQDPILNGTFTPGPAAVSALGPNGTQRRQ